MSNIHVHIHTKDAGLKDPQITRAKKAAEDSIRAAKDMCRTLRGTLKDADDKMEVQSAMSLLDSAFGKLNEVVSG